jgi:WD40 repeat protein
MPKRHMRRAREPLKCTPRTIQPAERKIHPERLAPVATLKGHQHPVVAVGFSPDGTYLVSGSSDGTIFVWDVSSKSVTGTIRHPSGVLKDLAVSRDGVLAAGAGVQAISLWSLRTSDLVRSVETEHYPSAIAFHPDGQTLVSAGSKRGAYPLTLGSYRTPDAWLGIGNRSQQACTLAVAPSGRYIATSDSTKVQLWNADGTLKANLNDTTESLAFSKDGKLLASGYEDPDGCGIKLWSVETVRVSATLPGHRMPVRSIVFSDDMIASGGYEGSILLRALRDGDIVSAVPAHSRWINSLSFSGDGRILASGSADGTVKLWRVER